MFSYVTIVRGAEGHFLSTPLLSQGHEPGLRDFSDDGGQVVFAVSVASLGGGLGVSISTALTRGLTLGEVDEKNMSNNTCIYRMT